MNEKLMNWIKSDEQIFKLQEKNTICIYMKVPKNECFNFIYCQNCYGYGDLMTKNFEYVGIYNKLDEQIYDAQYNLYFALNDDRYQSSNNKDNIKKAYQAEVRNTIESIIDNDRTKLSIKDISEIKNITCLNELVCFKKYGEPEKVKNLFLAEKTPDDILFKSNFILNNFSDEDFLQYLTDRNTMVLATASKWIEENQEKIFLEFYKNDILKEELYNLINDPQNAVHTIKRIISVMKDLDCKTVNVTTLINEIEFTFKTDAEQFKRNDQSTYQSWHIVSKDRKKFEDLYGKCYKYKPTDIKKISYGKKVLYDATKMEEDKL